MGQLLSIATCGVIKSTDFARIDHDITDTTASLRRLVSGDAAREREAQARFEKQSSIERRIVESERKADALQTQIDAQVARARKYGAMLKQRLSPEQRRKAEDEARLALREKRRLDAQVQTKRNAVRTARLALESHVRLRDNAEDRELLKEAAELSRGVKLDDAMITEISASAVEIADNAAEIAEHNREIDDAMETVAVQNGDAGYEHDLNDPNSLAAALADLEREVDEEHKTTTTTTAPLKRPAASVDDDNDDIAAQFPAAARDAFARPSPITIYTGENGARLATAETRDGKFGNLSAATSRPNATGPTSSGGAPKKGRNKLELF